MTTCFQQLVSLHAVCRFQTREGDKVGPASNSELRRWFANKCVEVNFELVGEKDPWPPVIKSIVLFPKNKKQRTTLFHDDSFTLIQLPELP